MTERVFQNIKSRVEVINGCHIWKGSIAKKSGLPNMQDEKGATVFTGKWLWNHTFESDLIDKYSSFQNTCKQKLCINLAHSFKKSRKQEVDYQKVWQRLLSRCVENEEGCLLFSSINKATGYGKSSFYGKAFDAHVISMMVTMETTMLPKVNENGDKLQVAHQCQNRNCISPSHLILKTISENNFEDKINSGTLRRGEMHYNSSISEETAKCIKLSKGVDKLSQKQRAELFGTTLNVVKSIDCKKSWAYLPDKDGLVSTERKLKSVIWRDNAKKRLWKPNDWDNAEKVLNANKVILTTDNAFVGSPCHEWTGSNNSIYGIATVNGKSRFVHVLANELKKRERKLEESVIRHLCGNHICINPEHLQEGTPLENSLDRFTHGTMSSKLNSIQVSEIRGSLEKHIVLAELYNVSCGTISSIKNNRTWKHQ